MSNNLNLLSATEAARAIREAEISSEDLVQDCLERISDVDDTVHAWASIDHEYALEQAR